MTQYTKQLLERLENEIFRYEIPNFFKKYKVYFITLNPPINEESLSTDIEAFNKKFTKIELSYSTYCFEKFVSSVEYPQRLHTHALIIAKKTKAFKQYTKLTPSWLKGASGMLSKRILRNSIDYKEVRDIKTLKYELSYINGWKRCKKKLELCKKDEVWRNQNKLEHVLIHTPLDSTKEKTQPAVYNYMDNLKKECYKEYQQWLIDNK